MKYLFSGISTHLNCIWQSFVNLMKESLGILLDLGSLVRLICISCLKVFITATRLEYALFLLSFIIFGSIAYLKQSIIYWILLIFYPVIYLLVGAFIYDNLSKFVIRNALLIATMTFVIIIMLMQFIGVML